MRVLRDLRATATERYLMMSVIRFPNGWLADQLAPMDLD